MAFIKKLDQIFEDKSMSVFDNMDKIIRLIKEAEGDDQEGDDQQQQQEPTDPTVPQDQQQQEAQPVNRENGIYISANEKADLAQTILKALQAPPPNSGEIPQNLLNVTDANADQVIKFVQSYLSLATAASLSDEKSTDSLAHDLKHI